MLQYFHCTRLLPEEATDVKTRGLRPPSLNLLQMKAMAAGGELSALQVASAQSTLDLLPEFISFFDQKTDLRIDNLVRRYFENWGGEQLLTALTPNDARKYRDVIAKRKSQPYIAVVELDSKDVTREPNNQSYTAKTGVVPKEIIPFDSLQFRELTTCDKWNPPLI